MMKWAVNVARKSYLPPPTENSNDVLPYDELVGAEEIIVRGCYSRSSLSTIGAHVLTTTTTTVTGDRRLHRRQSFDVRTLRRSMETMVMGRAKQRPRQSITYISESTLI